MQSRYISVLVAVLLFVPSCIRQPKTYNQTMRPNPQDNPMSYSRSARTKSTRASRSIHSATDGKSLDVRVKRLSDQIERHFKADNYSVEDLQRWGELYLSYATEYSISTQNLTDSQCESIEFYLGRIAGIIYKDGLEPVIEEVESIVEGIDNYEERSKRWRGAAERGFKSAAGDIDYDD